MTVANAALSSSDNGSKTLRKNCMSDFSEISNGQSPKEIGLPTELSGYSFAYKPEYRSIKLLAEWSAADELTSIFSPFLICMYIV
ncbi:MAG: hypothetical protein H0U49_03475 [Parachlamydiaceae bacterium]|nr:hypothetical protein [Parachlamydiaceae bacterium]